MRVITYREAIRETLTQQMKRDEKIFLMGEDIGVYGGAFGVTSGLIEQFGEDRVRDTPISELGFMGIAVGAAMTGMRPIVDIQFSDFLTLAMDQIVNQAAKIHYMYGGQMEVPLVIRTPSGSGTGAASQHSQSLEAWFTHIPGLKVIQPSTASDVKGLLQTAIEDPNPVLFFEHKLLYDTVDHVLEEPFRIPFGKAAIKRKGSDVTIIATGVMVQSALDAAERVTSKFSVEVIDPRTLVPLDLDTLVNSVRKTGKLIVVHEAVKRSGFGAEIVSQIAEQAFSSLQSAPIRLGGKETPIPQNKELEKLILPQIEDILHAIDKLCSQ